MTTRRSIVKAGAGLAAILAAGKAPAAFVRSFVAVRNAMLGGGLSAKSYVQDGLVAMWDGIENAGWGVHNPNATVWKDLAGSTDISMYHDVSALDEGFAFRVSGTNTGIGVASFPINYGCIEIVLNKASSPAPSSAAGCCIISIGSAYSGWGVCDSFGKVSDTNDNASAPYIVIPYDQRCYIALNKVSGSVLTEAVAKNGIMGHDGILAKNTRYNAGENCINYRTSGTASHSSRSSNLEIYAIRLYSRALTAAEVAANYAVDKARFSLPT